MKDIKISLLSTEKSKILGHIINKLVEYEINIHSIIYDAKIPGADHLQRWEEKTKGKIPLIPFEQFEKLYIPTYLFKNHSSTVTENFIKDQKIDLLVNAGTPRILKSNLLKAPSIGIINCHPGILPDFRGCTCVEWAIYLDQPIGNTVHLMTDKIDEGPIILKETVNFSKSDKYSDVRIKVYEHGFDLFARAIRIILDGNIIDYSYEKGGNYYKVIDENKMKNVIDKIELGQYKYQF